ncbi:putative toxin-antitoxin system toxin component, PIN family [Mucilaginibacter gynuensis]|uniref:Toxin-antitoxin system toxin component, PIN family n=1 Tax=Mucilaginibacter gynuensis TaxID=1302236 RepID=A0ABP8GQY5_9SPHI
MPDKPIRIILDTNIWISLLITKDYEKFDPILFSGKVVLIFSEELLSEFVTVAQRPKFRKYFTQTDLEELIEVIDESAEFIKVRSAVTACRDAKDNFLLSLAVDGKADYLISGDNDLLELNPFGQTHIITITEFLSIVNKTELR